MPEPTEKDIQRMQRDAEQRMREMQRRTSRYSGSHDAPQVPNFVRLSPGQIDRQRPKSQAQPPKQAQDTKPLKKPTRTNPQGNSNGVLNKGFNLLKMFNFQNFRLDSDITIIIVLILLISSEETDELLLLALAYIML